MHDVPNLSPLLQYGPLPLILAGGVVLLLAGWYGFVLWLTRRKPQKVLATLPPAQPPVVDQASIRKMYLERIEAIEKAYNSRELRARAVHQQLSVLLRQFVSEINRLPAQTMTLADLKRSRLSALAPIIESYYKPEFAAIENGSVNDALAAARKVVNEWS